MAKEQEVSANWQGRSLKFNIANSYVYYPWMKYIVGEKPVKLYAFVAGVVAGPIFGSFGGVLAYRLTSSVSKITGATSALLVGSTIITASLLLMRPSRNTNLLFDSVKSLVSFLFPKTFIKAGEIKEIQDDKIYFKDGRVGMMFLVSGTISPTTLNRHLAITADANSQARAVLGKVKTWKFESIESVDFEEAKADYRSKMSDKSVPPLIRNMALIQNRHIVENLNGEVAKKTIEIQVVDREEDLYRITDYHEQAINSSVISEYIQLTGDRLKRGLDNL